MLELLLLTVHFANGGGIVLEHTQGARKAPDFVAAGGVRHFEIIVPEASFSVSAVMVASARVTERLTAREVDQHQHEDRKAYPGEGPGRLPEDRIDIVEIDTGPDDPTPGSKTSYIGELADRLLEAQLRPEITVKAGTLLLYDVDKASKKVIAGRILEFAYRLAVEFGLGWIMTMFGAMSLIQKNSTLS